MYTSKQLLGGGAGAQTHPHWSELHPSKLCSEHPNHSNLISFFKFCGREKLPLISFNNNPFRDKKKQKKNKNKYRNEQRQNGHHDSSKMKLAALSLLSIK